jgi:hypothetical protein
MKVFMSWSGARSKAAAELLYDWIKCVVQASRPWISTRGIGRGSVWFTEINNELKDTSVGIICLTHQNKSSPWILFEAGALAKGLTTNKVCTFLVDLNPADIQDPLAQFNHTAPTRDGMLSLVATLNSALEVPLDGPTMLSVFETFWPKFEAGFAELLQKYPQEVEVEARTNDSMLEEILDSTRGLTHKIRDIESRLASNEPGNLLRSYASLAPNAWSVPGLSLTEAHALVNSGMDKNASFETIHRYLIERGMGKKAAKEIIEIVADSRSKANSASLK